MTENSDKHAFSSDKEHIFRPSQWFFSSEVFSSILLMIASVSAIYWANSFLAETYEHLLHTPLALSAGDWHLSNTLLHWVNDGLMALFFFTVGLEIKREILVGELADPKMALLPVIAAMGGMICPGLVYVAFNYGTPYMDGWGIPVATDIAFSLGAIAIFGKKLPLGLRIFLAAFAIADDLGAVLIIALFYTKNIVWTYLFAAALFVAGLVVANLLWVRWIPFYVVMGIGTWISVMGSGVHATVAGVVVALLIPARAKYSTSHFMQRVKFIMNRFHYNDEVDAYWYSILLNPDHLSCIHSLKMACQDVETPLQKLEQALHPWVAYMILPVFAFGNAGLSLEGMSPGTAMTHPVTLGIFLGLFLGKPLGISLFSYIAVRTGMASLPEGVTWTHLMGAAMLGGIGFTMSLFITGLSFTSPELLNFSKLGVLIGSIVSAIAGILFLSIDYARQKRKALLG